MTPAPRTPNAGRAASLTAEVAARLRSELVAGVHLPGVQLAEEATADRLGVSRNTLREAFRLLELERLVEHRRHRGVFVRSPGPAEVADTYRMRTMLEVGAIAMASPAHPALDAMRARLDESRAACARADWTALGTANMGFHCAILDLADSPRISAFGERMSAELRLAFVRVRDQGGFHEPFIERNAGLLALVEANRVAEAAEELRAYLGESERVLLEELSRLEGDVGTA
ncbi:hypothetical protein USB125703_01839 [Pseudoclavibacter triregionum]|nr:hypothetical protein USB125703_01839 [Pseudoclavibacter triregionum]